MPLPALPVVLLSLSCMGPKAARGREPWGSTSARPMAALLVYGWWGELGEDWQALGLHSVL